MNLWQRRGRHFRGGSRGLLCAHGLPPDHLLLLLRRLLLLFLRSLSLRLGRGRGRVAVAERDEERVRLEVDRGAPERRREHGPHEARRAVARTAALEERAAGQEAAVRAVRV